MANQAIRILIIEDEPGIALALYKTLTKADYQVVTAKTAASGLQKAVARKFDIILLDLGLPDMPGLAVCRQLRAEGMQMPIIVLTAEGAVRTKVDLFDAGANDYVTKPFSVDELQARIRACLRRVPEDEHRPSLTTGELTLHPATRTVERAGLIIPLRRKEFAILEYLMHNAGAAVSRASLLRHIWNDEDAWTNTVDVHIKHLRDKLDRPFDRPLIITVHGIGYKLDVATEPIKK